MDPWLEDAGVIPREEDLRRAQGGSFEGGLRLVHVVDDVERCRLLGDE